jgi:hypothetical protein
MFFFHQVPCYVSDNFVKLAEKGQYVIDCQHLGSGPMSSYDKHPDLSFLADPIRLKSLIEDYVEKEIPILYQIRWRSSDDCVNFIFDGTVHFFGFDFSSKQGTSIINIKNPTLRKMDNELAFLSYKRDCVNNMIDNLRAYKSFLEHGRSIYYKYFQRNFFQDLYPEEDQKIQTLKEVADDSLTKNKLDLEAFTIRTYALIKKVIQRKL